MIFFQFIIDFFIVVTIISVAIKFLLPKSNWIDVISYVYNGALVSIFLAAYLGFVDIPLLLLLHLWVLLGIGGGLTMFKILKTWDSRKK